MVTASASEKRNFALNIKIWFLETRPQFLILPIILILVGTSAAWYEGALNIPYAVLALVGLLLCHASVNILNDYFDYKSGVDLKTPRTPFSGGSGILPAGHLKPKQVLCYGIACFILAVPVGIYFTLVRGWLLLPLIIVGAVCILFYTSIILKIRYPEWSPGLGLGLLPVLGAYFVQTGDFTVTAFIAAVPSGFLVSNLLLLNEFPDAEADRIGSKQTLPITSGKRKSALVYTSLTAVTYLWIIVTVAVGLLPVYCLMALLTLPLAVKAVRGSFNYSDMNKLVPAMANNVIIVLAIPALLGIGFVLAGLF